MKTRVLITVKTYPTISRTYSELVCTAGLLEDGSWIRIYPIPYRQWDKQYRKYQWVELSLVKNKNDRRGESHSLLDPDSIELKECIDTSQGWYERKKLILDNGTVYKDLDQLIESNKAGDLSLATFKPSQIKDMVVEEVDREWDQEKLAVLKERSKQSDLFNDTPEYFKMANKLPYKFSFRLVDEKGKESTMMVEDWEVGALYWNCLKKYSGNEKLATSAVRNKFLNEIAKTKDIYLFLGTTLQYDGWALNPFIIIGLFYPPIDNQQTLF